MTQPPPQDPRPAQAKPPHDLARAQGLADLSRRSLLTSGAVSLAAPLAIAAAATTAAAPVLLAPRAAQAAAPLQGEAAPAPFFRFRLGGFEITTLLAGSRSSDAPQETFGLDASPEDFAAVAAAHALPTDRTQNFFTPVLVNTGSTLVLFDTGLQPEGILAALAAASVAPEAIDLVVLTHMHGDHIGGLSGPQGPTFPAARYATGQIEWDHWAAANNDGFEAKLRPLADQITLLADGDSPVPGLTARLAPGHTPGHMAWMIESEGHRLMLTADTVNHFAFSLPRPDWQVRFDMDKPQAAATRRQILGQLAEENLPFIGYHMPFPAVGYVVALPEAEGGGPGGGYRYLPLSYQHHLGLL